MAKKILIVDDESDVAIYLATVLRANGYEAVIASSASAAMNSIQQDRPDLISLDIVMPEESGIALYRRLRSTPESTTIPVIIVSGVGDAGAREFETSVAEESIAAPDCYMDKPIDIDEYIAAIEKLTGASQRVGGEKGK
jgi:DNA-binding response OmpR family regulator